MLSSALLKEYTTNNFDINFSFTSLSRVSYQNERMNEWPVSMILSWQWQRDFSNPMSQ